MAAVGDTYDVHEYAGVDDRDDEAIVPDAIFPERSKLVASKRFTDRSRIVDGPHTLIEESQNALCNWPIKFCELLFSRRKKLNPPDHTFS